MQRSKVLKPATLTLFLLLSSTALIPTTLAQNAETEKQTMVSHKTMADPIEKKAMKAANKTNPFIKKLTPPTPISFASASYRKKIIQLKWFSQKQEKMAFVNQNTSFDLFDLFDGNSTALSNVGKATLDDIGQALTMDGIKTRMFLIAAHSTAEGRNSKNQQQTTLRAKAVKTYLLSYFDIAPNHLQTVGFGSYRLKDRTQPNAKTNNRVEIALIEDIYNHEPGAVITLPKNTQPIAQTEKNIPDVTMEHQAGTTAQRAVTLEHQKMVTDPVMMANSAKMDHHMKDEAKMAKMTHKISRPKKKRTISRGSHRTAIAHTTHKKNRKSARNNSYKKQAQNSYKNRSIYQDTYRYDNSMDDYNSGFSYQSGSSDYEEYPEETRSYNSYNTIRGCER